MDAAATILPQKREDDEIIVGAKFQKREDDAIIVDQPLAKFQKQEDDAIIVDQPPANFQKLHQPQSAVDPLNTNVYEKIERDEIDMKGTTAFAFRTIDLSGTESIKVVVDSRASSEKKGVITIERADKFYIVTPNIVALMVGSQNRCYELRSDLRDWVRAFDTVTILELVNHIENYLKELLNKNPEIQHEFGNIVAGYDTTEQFQIYRIGMMDGKVIKVKAIAFTSMGSGAYYATRCFTSHYTLTCADDVSKEFALKTLFDASYYDKRTDGNIKCVPITINGAQELIEIDSLEAYLRFYADYDEKCVLFLAYNAYKTKKKTENDEKMVKILNPILSVDLLAGYFRKYGRVIAAHCVSTRVHQIAHHPKATFYFHRIIFCSPGEADEACKEIHKHAQPNDSETIPLKPFSHVLEELDYKLLVMKASISGLEHIIKHSAEAEEPPKI